MCSGRLGETVRTHENDIDWYGIIRDPAAGSLEITTLNTAAALKSIPGGPLGRSFELAGTAKARIAKESQACLG